MQASAKACSPPVSAHVPYVHGLWYKNNVRLNMSLGNVNVGDFILSAPRADHRIGADRLGPSCKVDKSEAVGPRLAARLLLPGAALAFTA